MESSADVGVHVGKLKNRDVSVIAEHDDMAATLNLCIPTTKFVKKLQNVNRVFLSKIACDLQGMWLVPRN
jgi:hypothetical protein